MSSLTLRAHYDGKHIVLDEPCELPADTPVLITVASPAGSDHAIDLERTAWATLGARNLSRAYGDDEPEYSIADLKS